MSATTTKVTNDVGECVGYGVGRCTVYASANPVWPEEGAVKLQERSSSTLSVS